MSHSVLSGHSLNDGVDRLAFSVVWTLDEQCNVKKEWFGRTVIRSCAKLAYGHAQAVIEVNVDAHRHAQGDVCICI